MPSVDVRAAMRGALDVDAPAFRLERIRRRAVERALAQRTRIVRLRGALMLAFALLTLVAGTHGRNDPVHLVAASPMPAPEPQPS